MLVLLFVLVTILMVVGMPVALAMGLSALVVVLLKGETSPMVLAQRMFVGVDSLPLLAIPYFILAGALMEAGGISVRLIRFASTLVGHIRGGLGMVAVVASMIFAGISGSAAADTSAIGSIMMPAMVKAGFPKRFGAGVITTSGSLGILIPPSIPMVIYCVATNSSVGALFMGGVVPGLMLATLLGLVAWYLAKKNNYPRLPKATFAERFKAFRESVWGLLLIVIVLGGIYSGIFTPTEAAAVSAVYAFVIAVFVYRDVPFSRIPKVLLDSASMSAMLLYIITNAVLFSFLMTHENIPQIMADWILGHNLGVISFLLVTNVLLLLAGNVMEPSSIILILAPILFPVAMKLGIDPVHFGVLITVNMEVGMCHPPVGLNLYVASGITKMGISELTVAVLPWLLAMLGFLILVTYVPIISLWLPRLLGY